MRHNYRRMLAYNPVKKEVTVYRAFTEDDIFDSQLYDETFYEVWALSNHTTETVIGFSLTNDIYQLSPAGYGTYVKEDYYAGGGINKGAVLTAIAEYKKKNNVDFDEDW